MPWKDRWTGSPAGAGTTSETPTAPAARRDPFWTDDARRNAITDARTPMRRWLGALRRGWLTRRHRDDEALPW